MSSEEISKSIRSGSVNRVFCKLCYQVTVEQFVPSTPPSGCVDTQGFES